MDHHHQVYFAAQAVGPPRKETLLGKEYRVVPAVMVQEQVLNNNLGPVFLPAEHITAEWASAWNGMPIVIDHPTQEGMPITARSPRILELMGIGFVFNAKVDGKKIRAEAWLEESRAEAVPDLQEILRQLDEGKTPELSTGFPTALQAVNGKFKGTDYIGIMHPTGTDHLAVFARKRGACSVAHGCGLGVNHEGDCSPQAEPQTLETPGEPEGDRTLMPDDEKTAANSGEEGTGDVSGETPPPEDSGIMERMGRRVLALLEKSGLWLPIAENESDEDRRRLLQDSLRKKFATLGRYIWVVAVYSDDGFVVFEAEGDEGEGLPSRLFRVDFSVTDDGGVEFTEPVAVRQVTEFLPVANEAGDTHEEDSMDRKTLIAHLAEAGPLGSEELNKLTDCQLKALHAAGGDAVAGNEGTPQTQEPTQDPQPTGQDTAAVNALLEEMRGMKEILTSQATALNRLQEITAPVVAQTEQEKTSLVAALVANQKVQFAQEELEGMDVSILRKLHGSVQTRNFGLSGAPRVAASNEQSEPTHAPVAPYWESPAPAQKEG